MKSTFCIFVIGVAAISAIHFEQNQLIRLRRAIVAAHVRARRQILNGTTVESPTKPKSEEAATSSNDRPAENQVVDDSTYDHNYGEYDYGDVNGDYQYDPLDHAVVNSFRQHLLAYPNGQAHLMCIEECKPFLSKINKFDSGEISDSDPYDLRLFTNTTDNDVNADGDDFLINVSGDLPPFWDILGNGSTKFDKARFESMCAAYSSGVKCVDKCPFGFFTRLINGVYRPVEYICDVAKEQYVKYATCGQDADLSTCRSKCPSPSLNNDTHSLESGMDKISSMCGHIICQTDCAKPEIVKACDNDPESGKIFQQMVSQLVGAVTDLTMLLGFAPGPVGDCVDIIANATMLPSEKHLPPPLDLFGLPGSGVTLQNQLEVVQLQLLTLQVIKTQKELLNLDLQNEHLTIKIKQQLSCPDKACSASTN